MYPDVTINHQLAMFETAPANRPSILGVLSDADTSRCPRYHWVRAPQCAKRLRRCNLSRTGNLGASINGGTPKLMFYRENPIKMDDLGVPPFMETSI